MSIKNANGVDITNTGNFAIVNPFRYRGYYYDTESGLYYLQSRYYDPTTGRFVNADSFEYLGASGDILGFNLFAYCENNPCNSVDQSGKWVSSILGFTFQCGALFGAALSIYLVVDSYGNKGLYFVPCFSICFPCVGITASWFHSWRKTIYDLNGSCTAIGFSAGKLLSGGVDILFDIFGICGIQFNLGVGVAVPFDVHISIGHGLLVPLGKSVVITSAILLGTRLRYKFSSSYRWSRHRGGSGGGVWR